MNVSRQCEIASMPVAAVKPLGSPNVNAGSQMARVGMIKGYSTPSLRPLFMLITAARPTSDPVPAVVGTAIIGAMLP